MIKRTICISREAEDTISKLKHFFEVEDELEVLEIALSFSLIGSILCNKNGCLEVVNENKSKITVIEMKKACAHKEGNPIPTNYLLN